MTQTTDLNERVQARLTQLESMAGSLRHDLRDPQHQLMWFLPPWGLSMVESWRGRWERHQLGSARPIQPLPCRWCAMECEWPCPDALSVLREIGIEP